MTFFIFMFVVFEIITCNSFFFTFYFSCCTIKNFEVAFSDNQTQFY